MPKKLTYVEAIKCSTKKRPLRSPTQLGSDIAECDGRRRLAARLKRLLDKWEPILGVHIAQWKIQDMKTYWASVNEGRSKITFNTKLADMSPAFLEATVVHELVHLLTDGHDARFYELMDRHVPGWRKLHAKYAEPMTRHS